MTILTCGITTNYSTGSTTLSLFLNGKTYTYTEQSHTKFFELVDAVREYGKAAPDTAKSKYKALQDKVISFIKPEYLVSVTERTGVLSFKDRVITFNGKPLHGVLIDRIVEFSDKNLPYDNLLRFLEKLQSNPDERSREQLFRFLESNEFPPIAPDGDFIAYKGVNNDYTSVNRGAGIVNGTMHENTHLDNSVGNIISMPRHMVNADPKVGCSHGLHVGSWKYVSSFGTRKVIVKVNPRDVVSVPEDCSYQKVRCCRYEVVGDFEGEIKTLTVETKTENMHNFIASLNDDTVKNSWHLANRTINNLHPEATPAERSAYLEEYEPIARQVIENIEPEIEEHSPEKETPAGVDVGKLLLHMEHSLACSSAGNIWHLTGKVMDHLHGKGGWSVKANSSEYYYILDQLQDLYISLGLKEYEPFDAQSIIHLQDAGII